MTQEEQARLESALEILLQLVTGESNTSERPPPPPPMSEQLQVRGVTLAMQELRDRKYRREHFGALYLGSDSGWEILLELFVAMGNEKRLLVSMVGLESQIPPTTALRWLGLLLDAGLIRKESDMLDKRRQWISLTDRGLALMLQYFKTRYATGVGRDGAASMGGETLRSPVGFG